MSKEKVYLGDSVYLEKDGDEVILSTENGFAVTNTIFLEPKTLNALCDCLNLVRRKAPDESEE